MCGAWRSAQDHRAFSWKDDPSAIISDDVTFIIDDGSAWREASSGSEDIFVDKWAKRHNFLM